MEEEITPIDMILKRSFLDFKKRRLHITDSILQYDGKKLSLESIIECKYGIHQMYVNGVKANRTYTIDVRDANENEIKILFQSAKLFGTNKQMEKDYQDILNFLWDHCFTRILNDVYRDLTEGKDFTVGKAVVTPKGVKMQVRHWFKKQEHFVEWKDMRKSSQAGYFHIFSQENKRAKLSFNYQNVWNTSILESLLSYLWEEGRAFQLAEMSERF
ncbi:MAG: hypothetical protein AAF518_05790 [Spirochaetota bacterium]